MKRWFDYLLQLGLIALLAIFGLLEIKAGLDEIKLNQEFAVNSVEVDARLVGYHHVSKRRGSPLFAPYGDQPILAYEDASLTTHEHIAREYGFIPVNEQFSFSKQKFTISYLSTRSSEARVQSIYVSSAWQMLLAGFLSLVMFIVIVWDSFISDRLKR